jgi:hypothetical protein
MRNRNYSAEEPGGNNIGVSREDVLLEIHNT